MKRIKLKIKKRVFNNIFYKYLKLCASIEIFYGGAGSGKSCFLADRCVLDVVNGRNYLVIRKIGATLKKSVFNQILKSIRKFKLSSIFDINKSDMVITCLINRRQIVFSGIKDEEEEEKLKSITPIEDVFTDIWAEEATQLTYKNYKTLRKRLRGRTKFKKRFTFSFNPIYRTHWIAKEFFKDFGDNQKELITDNLIILKTTYKDNKFLSKEDKEALENEKDRYFYEVYTLGNWGILGGVIFRNWRTEDLSNKLHLFDKRKYGLDFGFSVDPASMPCSHYDRKNKTLYIYDEVYDWELTNEELAERIKSKAGDNIIVADCAEPKSIRELQKYKVRAIACKKGKDSIKHGIKWLKSLNIIIDPKCTGTIDNFTLYKYREDKDGNVLPEPVDKNNHSIDALRYAYTDEFLFSDDEEDIDNYVGGYKTETITI